MKKYLIALAALSMVLVGCKDNNQGGGGGEGGSEYTKIALKPNTLELGIGQTQKLTVLYEPTSLEPPTCTWSTSNAEVATVANGTVTAVAPGEANITAKVGDLTAVCKVTVKDPWEMIKWGGFSVWGINKTDILSTDTLVTTISYQGGTEVQCILVSCTWAIWNDDIVLSDDDITGTGFWVETPGSVWLITEDLGKGKNYHYLGTGRLDIVDADKYNKNDTAFANCIPAGKLGSAAEHLAWLNDETSTLEDVKAIKGAHIDAIAWSGQSGQYEGFFYGLLGTGVMVEYPITETQSEYLYKMNASWWLEDDVAYGLKFVYDESTQKWSPKEPAEWGILSDYYYEYLGEEAAAPKYTAKEPRNFDKKFKIDRTNLPNNVLIQK